MKLIFPFSFSYCRASEPWRRVTVRASVVASNSRLARVLAMEWVLREVVGGEGREALRRGSLTMEGPR